MIKLEFDMEGSNWIKSLTPKEIHERQFKPSVFLLNNSHPIIDKLNEELFANYKCIFKFKPRGYNDEHGIFVNKTLVKRKNKFGPMHFTKGVKLIEGTPTEAGGSNNYPRIGFKEGYCILEFISNGIPVLNYSSGWIIDEIILFEKI